MVILLSTVFLASVLGSLHCVGMCGPFALLAGQSRLGNSSPSSQPSGRWWAPTVAYSLGRLMTYTVVGLAFGSLGLALNQSVPFEGWQQTATWVAGGLMVLVGLVALARQWGLRIQLPSVAGRLQRILQSNFRRVSQQPPLRRALLIGALTCLMPCGWLYTFAIVAAGTGSPWTGALVMATFWAGTVPVLSALMLGLQHVGHTVQRRIPALMACLVILLGVYTMSFRAPIALSQDPPLVDPHQSLVEQVQTVDQHQLPCCEH